MTLGQKISEARKKKGMTLEQLGNVVNMSRATLSIIENDGLKNGPDPETVNRIADALGDNDIRLSYLECNPVFQAVIPRIFPELNNIKREPAIVFSRFADEADEAVKSARALAQLFSHANPEGQPGFKQVFVANMEQIVDIQRCAEILMTSLIAGKILSEADRMELHDRQQQKCEAKGHHIPRSGEDRRDPESGGCPLECDQRSGVDRRTGTEG